MKYTVLSIFTLIILAISFYPQKEIVAEENGSPGAKTNSPIDGQNCTGCHAGSINSGAGTTSITTNIIGIIVAVWDQEPQKRKDKNINFPTVISK